VKRVLLNFSEVNSCLIWGKKYKVLAKFGNLCPLSIYSDVRIKVVMVWSGLDHEFSACCCRLSINSSYRR